MARSGTGTERAMIEADGERRRAGTPLCPAGLHVILMTPLEWMDERPRDKKRVCCFVQRGNARDEARKGFKVGRVNRSEGFPSRTNFIKSSSIHDDLILGCIGVSWLCTNIKILQYNNTSVASL